MPVHMCNRFSMCGISPSRSFAVVLHLSDHPGTECWPILLLARDEGSRSRVFYHRSETQHDLFNLYPCLTQVMVSYPAPLGLEVPVIHLLALETWQRRRHNWRRHSCKSFSMGLLVHLLHTYSPTLTTLQVFMPMSSSPWSLSSPSPPWL